MRKRCPCRSPHPRSWWQGRLPTILACSAEAGLSNGLASQERSPLASPFLEGIRLTVSNDSDVHYDPQGQFVQLMPGAAPLGIVVLAEPPYAEGFGDRADLTLPQVDIQLIERMRPLCRRLVVLLLSGRPLVITNILPLVDALVAAWLPGTEGQGIADVLFGDRPFSGRLSYSWPRDMGQVPMPPGAQPLFPIGYGL